MAEEEKQRDEHKGVSRREFLSGAGMAVAGAAIGVGLPLAVEAETAMAPVTKVEIQYSCPIDGQHFATFESLRGHFASTHPAAAVPATTKLKVNGQEYQIQIEPHWTLQHTLQFQLGLTGAKTMCDHGECGSCTVLIDGKPALSCTTLAVECEGRAIETIEGIAANPKWKPLIDAYMKWDAAQCGYCTPGFVVNAKALLEQNPNPTDEEIKQALSGNLCRCGTYPRHSKAVLEAAQLVKGGK